ncbi:hypothetical protein AB4876_09310 [Zhongshania guokunii]|uniref:DNA polymerase III beta subunit-like protein n=1 Tax=Zhongshania guokunii TaxID=641783 RepID=A0ABV3U574_9GAMM
MTDNTTEATPITAIFKMVYLAALEVFMARNDVRYYLNGICVKPCSEGGVLLTATDGAHLLMIRDKSGFASREFIIPNMSHVLKICKPAQSKKSKILSDTPSAIVIDDNRLNIVTESFCKIERAENELGEYQDHLHSAWPFKEIDGKYPDIERILPRETPNIKKATPDPAVQINSKYLADIHKAMSRLCPKTKYVTTIAQRGKYDPLVVVIGAPDIEAFAIIMPMRYDETENCAVPNWAYNSPSPEATKETAAAA